YYEVYVGADPIDPSTSYYGEYFYESTGTSFNLSAQTDIDLGYNTTWYWAVLPFNSGGLSPDPLDHNFMVFDFTTLPDPTITSLPHNEYFDTVTAPALPWGWSSYINSTVTTGYVNTYNSSSYAVSTPNSVRLYNSTDTAATVMLITPDFTTPLRNIKVRFYARTSTAGDNLLVGSVDPTTHVFTQVGVISALTTTHTQYEVLFTSYVGTDTFIAFKHGGGTSSRTIYIDNVEFIELVDNDLAATAITGPGYGIVGTPLQFDVTVKNEGLVAQNAYNIHLKRYGDDRLISMPVNTPIAPGATATYTISWTPTPAQNGTFELVGEVELTGDSTAGNNETVPKTVYVAPTTVSVLSVGDPATTTTANTLPTDVYYKNGVTEMLYFNDELHMSSGNVTALVFKNNFTQNMYNLPFKIWMANTTATSVSGGWTPTGSLSLVFDGTLDFPIGVNQVAIPLQTPFNYTGGNLVVRVNRVMDSVYYLISNVWYYTSTATAHPSRALYLQSDTTLYDPLAPTGGTTLSQIPNTWFIVDNAVLQQQAILSGHVYQGATTTPIAGATVTLTERLTATTDTNGFYQFTFWANTNVDVTAAMANYYSQSFTNLALTMGNTVTQDFHLTPLPRVTVGGRVLANDAPAGLIGASVALNGTENQSMTTLAD
ncbi:MAG TPA: carboxypeptidase regulatory-like domain-containing protein, partial [Candidatus Cloacimonadota bacterium]|nr:carboxypeptidase regulatory-like domain-containing protein [Candidatus Cloacimonadota bacterium]